MQGKEGKGKKGKSEESKRKEERRRGRERRKGNLTSTPTHTQSTELPVSTLSPTFLTLGAVLVSHRGPHVP